MREFAAVQTSQDFGLSIPWVEELVRFQHDVSRTRRNPENDVRRASVGNRRGSSEGANAPPVEGQGVSRSSRKFHSSPKRVDDEPRVDLPTPGFYDGDC